MKTSELQDIALNWAVGVCEGYAGIALQERTNTDWSKSSCISSPSSLKNPSSTAAIAGKYEGDTRSGMATRNTGICNLRRDGRR